jgi:hypothetical protein
MLCGHKTLGGGPQVYIGLHSSESYITRSRITAGRSYRCRVMNHNIRSCIPFHHLAVQGFIFLCCEHLAG